MSRGPKNFEDAIEHVKDEVPTVAGAAKDTLGDLEREFRKIWSTLQGMTGEVAPAASRAKDEAEKQVAQSPWLSIGVVGLIAFVLGCIVGGRRSE